MIPEQFVQTYAIVRDTYREMNSKRQFWFVLGISVLVVMAMGLVVLTPAGLRIDLWAIWWDFDFFVNSEVVQPVSFYKWLFIGLGVRVWLSWAAMIIAIVSTAGLIPDLTSSGSIELTLSRPIGRLRLLLTKYLSGLLFVALQVTMFTGGAYVVIGLRGEAWEPGIFLAIPIVLAVFSYLFSISALVGLTTRSATAAILVTLVAWLGLFGIHQAEQFLHQAKIVATMRVDVGRQIIDERATALAGDINELHTDQTGAETDSNESVLVSILQQASREQRIHDLDRRRVVLERDLVALGNWRLWHAIFFHTKGVLPKTGETSALLYRYLLSTEDFEALDRLNRIDGPDPLHRRQFANENEFLGDAPEDISRDDPRVQQQFIKERQQRPLWWVLGTSLGFEAVILGWACLVFYRRDFGE